MSLVLRWLLKVGRSDWFLHQGTCASSLLAFLAAPPDTTAWAAVAVLLLPPDTEAARPAAEFPSPPAIVL